MRNDRRTLKLDRIVQLRRPTDPPPPNPPLTITDAPVLISTPRRTGARIYDAPAQPAENTAEIAAPASTHPGHSISH